MLKRIIAPLLCALVALVVWTGLAGEVGLERSPITLERGPHSERPTNSLTSASQGPVASREDADGVIRDRAEEAKLTPALDQGRPVRVLDARNGTQLAGALITWMRFEREREVDLAQLKEDLSFLLPIDELQTDLDNYVNAQRYQADEAGRLFLPTTAGIVMAHSGELWAFEPLLASSEPCDLLLEPDSTIRVHVVDSIGRPATEVKVALVQRTASDWEELVSSISGAEDGVAVFPHLGSRLRQVVDELSSRRLVGARHYFVPIIHAAEPALIEVDITRPPVGDLELALPETGQVVVEVVDQRGQPLSGHTLVDLQDDHAGYFTFPEAFVNEQIAKHKLSGSSRTVYRYVGLGLSLTVDAKRMIGSTSRYYETQGPGPERGGEQVTMKLTIPSNYPILRGRAVSSSGEVLANERISFEALEQRARAKVASCDERGSWSLHLDGGEHRQWQGELLRAYGHESGGYNAAALRVPPKLHEGLNDVGDIILQEPRLLASGVVLDPEGKPKEGARISANKAAASHSEVIAKDVETDDDGRFELLGHTSARSFSLSAEHSDRAFLAPLPQHVLVGSKGIEFELAAAGSLGGTLQLAQGVPPTSFVVKIHPGLGDAHGYRLRQDASFTFRGLPPRRYDLIVRRRGAYSPLIELKDIEVRAGERTTLDPIDLTALRALCISAVDSEGRTISDFDVEVRDHDGPDRDFDAEFTSYDSEVRVVTSRQSVDLRVTADRFRVVELHDVRWDRTVELLPWYEVRLQLAPDTSLAQQPLLRVFAELEFMGEAQGEDAYSSDDSIPVEGGRLFYLDRAGEWRVELLLIGQLEEGGDWWDAPLKSTSFTVTDTSSEQPFELSLTQAELAAALAKFARD